MRNPLGKHGAKSSRWILRCLYRMEALSLVTLPSQILIQNLPQALRLSSGGLIVRLLERPMHLWRKRCRQGQQLKFLDPPVRFAGRAKSIRCSVRILLKKHRLSLHCARVTRAPSRFNLLVAPSATAIGHCLDLLLGFTVRQGAVSGSSSGAKVQAEEDDQNCDGGRDPCHGDEPKAPAFQLLCQPCARGSCYEIGATDAISCVELRPTHLLVSVRVDEVRSWSPGRHIRPVVPEALEAAPGQRASCVGRRGHQGLPSRITGVLC